MDSFGTFCGFAGDQDWLPKAGGFFLDAAGIADKEVTTGHEPDEIFIADRIDQFDAILATQGGEDRLTNHGVQMDGEQNPKVGKIARQLLEDAAEVFHPSTVRLAAVGGDQEKRRGVFSQISISEAIGNFQSSGDLVG